MDSSVNSQLLLFIGAESSLIWVWGNLSAEVLVKLFPNYSSLQMFPTWFLAATSLSSLSSAVFSAMKASSFPSSNLRSVSSCRHRSRSSRISVIFTVTVTSMSEVWADTCDWRALEPLGEVEVTDVQLSAGEMKRAVFRPTLLSSSCSLKTILPLTLFLGNLLQQIHHYVQVSCKHSAEKKKLINADLSLTNYTSLKKGCSILQGLYIYLHTSNDSKLFCCGLMTRRTDVSYWPGERLLTI